jgi:hypothetical protein
MSMQWPFAQIASASSAKAERCNVRLDTTTTLLLYRKSSRPHRNGPTRAARGYPCPACCPPAEISLGSRRAARLCLVCCVGGQSVVSARSGARSRPVP